MQRVRHSALRIEEDNRQSQSLDTPSIMLRKQSGPLIQAGLKIPQR
ncbi:hypothetical protein [Bordetella ansorpii]|nr:hypothetical protein [Bordetella ansorpii]